MAKQGTKILKKRIKKSDITLRLQVGTTNTLIAQWVWSQGKTANYRVLWEYLTKDGIWFKGKEEDLGKNVKLDTYDFPELATQVRFRIRPLSETYETNINNIEVAVDVEDEKITGFHDKPVQHGATVYYWHADWSAYKIYKIKPDITPEKPSAPSIEIDMNVISLRSESYDQNTTHMKFEIWKDDSVIVDSSAFIKLVTNVVSYKRTVDLGHRYKARVMGYNSKDKSKSDWSDWSSEVKTVPDAINSDSLAVEATSSTSVKLTWDRIGENVTGYTIEYTTDPELFDQSGSTQSTTVGAVNPYAIVEGLETGKRWYFRIKATNDQGDSAWSRIVDCLIGTTPTAPTIWSSTSAAVVGETVSLYWVHNSEDGSREDSAKLEITWPSGHIDVETIPKTDDSNISRKDYMITESYGEGTVSWAVQTKGAMPDYGPYSEAATFKILVQPVLNIGLYRSKKWLWDPFNFLTDTIYTAKGELSDPISGDMIIRRYPFFIYAKMFPFSQMPIECNFSIYATDSYLTLNHVGEESWVNAGDTLFSKTLPYDIAENQKNQDRNSFILFITPSDVMLENFTTYRLVCTAVSNNGLSASAEIQFTMEIEEESFIPDAEIGIDIGTISAYIKPVAYDEEENVVGGVRLSVYRIQFDGKLQQVGAEVESSAQTMIVDPHPNLNRVRYRVVGFSNTTGEFVYYDLPAFPVSVPEIVLQWDEQWRSYEDISEDSLANPVWTGSILRLPYNIDTTENSAIDVELVEYIGRDHPVSYYGTQVGQTMTLSTDIPRTDENTIFVLRRLMRYMGDVYVREPTGAGYWAQVTVSFSTTHKEVVIPVSISVTRVDGGE